MIPSFSGGLGVVEVAWVGLIVGNSGVPELATAVAAGAFVHRIFAWLVPIIIGLLSLIDWRRKRVKKQSLDAAASEYWRSHEQEGKR